MNKSSYYKIKKPELDTDTLDTAAKFATTQEICTGNIAYRELRCIIKNYSNGSFALDYGCGAGFSTNLLKELGFKVIGADISLNMLEEAKKLYNDIEFTKILYNKTHFPDKYFDLILSTFVLFDIPSIKDVTAYLAEAKRILKPNGIFIACTDSEDMHKHNWLTQEIEVERYKNIKSGDTYKVHLTNHDISFHDYYYTNEDYLKAFKKAGLKFLKLYQPLGKKEDGIEWTTEWTIPPYSIYVCEPDI